MKQRFAKFAKLFAKGKQQNVQMQNVKKSNATADCQHQPQKENWELSLEDTTSLATVVPLDDRIIVRSPDGGWGWVVVFASLVSNLVVEGIIFNVGQIFQPVWEKEFNTSVSAVSWVVSIAVSWINFAGPVTGCLINLLGCRAVGFIGTFLALLGFVTSLPAKSIVHLYFTFGFIGGTGLGLIMLSSVIVVNYYFEKKRALATGLAICGSGIGVLSLGPLFTILVEFYGWRGALLLSGGFLLQCAVCSSVYWTLEPTKSQVRMLEEEVTHQWRKMTMQQVEFSSPRGSVVSTAEMPPPSPPPPGPAHVEEPVTIKCSVVEPPLVPLMDTISLRPAYNRYISETLTIKNKPVKITRSCSLRPDFIMTEIGKFGHLRKLSNDIIRKVNNPLNRKDIFYRSSLEALQRQVSVRPQVPERIIEEITEEAEPIVLSNKIRDLLHPFKIAMSNLLDVNLMRSPTFIVWVFQGMLFCFVSMVPFIFLPQRAVDMGYSKRESSLFVSFIGLMNVIFRILCGLCADMPSVNPVMLQNYALLLAAAGTVMVPFLKTYWLMMIYCIFFAVGLACFAVLRSITAVQLFGLPKLTNAVGLSMVLFGVAGLLGPPFGGYLVDITGTHDLTFFAAGAIMTASSLVGFLMFRVQKMEANWSKK